ncbi:hypothetical protein XENOCAPTIV_021637, partial [Xenoophorus captivus]
NMLGGAIFGPWEGLMLACLLATFGSTFCFLLSSAFGKQYVVHFFPEKVDLLQRKVSSLTKQKLKIENLTSRGSDHTATVLPPPPGLIPYNFICVRTGSILSQISSLDDIFSWGTLAQLLAIALMALLPGALIKHYSRAHLKVDGIDCNGTSQMEISQDKKRR